MNILFLDAYYEPEKIAYTHLERDLIEGLISDGHKIKIICPTPTRGIDKETREKYKNKIFEEKYNGSVEVNRFKAPQEGKNPIVRAFRYFWCNFRTYQIALKSKNVDVVFSNSTPPTQGAISGIVARKLSKKYKKKVSFVYNLQDIFPDSLVNTNLTHNGSVLWKIGRKLEDFTYRHADKIIVISQAFKKNLLAKGVSEKKVEIISNWIDLESVQPVERKDNKLIDEFDLDPSKFLVVYAGNFGAAQGADIVIKAAMELQDYKDIQFVIFGGGPYFEDAREQAKNLDNIFIHELMPQDRISEVYALPMRIFPPKAYTKEFASIFINFFINILPFSSILNSLLGEANIYVGDLNFPTVNTFKRGIRKKLNIRRNKYLSFLLTFISFSTYFCHFFYKFLTSKLF